ncbi:hypothetical protein LCGC14_2968580 [marine sediment metagenome]|uniref:Uncharacterized protein n=1 Tax=marine sediment metagenome TaxID=412755 RepID=A0A0F8XXK0_9ZZZZ
MKTSKLIKFLFILPRNKHHCQFQINNEPNLRSMTYEDMYDYILALVPTKSQEIYERLLVYHKNFFVDVIKSEIKDLTFDSNIEIKKLKESMRNFNMGVVAKELKKIRKLKKTMKGENKLNDSFFKIFAKFKKY